MLKFTKMQGTGNDYIYINCIREKVENPEQLARKFSDRHFGIGADGLILIRPSRRADFCMEMYNADGSLGEMCGNGIRCLGKYVYEHGMTEKMDLIIETKAGLREIRLLETKDRQGKRKIGYVQVNMGRPVLEADQVPAVSEHTYMIDEPVKINGCLYHITAVSMGNPHAVIFVSHRKGLDLEWLGPAVEYHGRFPRRVNAEFVEVLDRRTIGMRVWERGSKETLSCGTGACAAVVAGVLNDLTDRHVTVKLIGGDLLVEWKEDTEEVLLTGPAVEVFDGEI